MTTNNATTNARRLVEADREISEHFTAAVGGKAQNYDPSSGSDVSMEEMIMSPGRSRARARYRIVQAMLEDLSSAHRRILRLVYSRTDTMSDATDDDGKPFAGKPVGLITGKNGSPDPLGLLRLALMPTWGHGSYLGIAPGQHRALTAFAKKHPGRSPTGDAVLDHLAFEAGRGDSSAGMLAKLRDECESARDEALAAFDIVRTKHLSAAKDARAKAEAAEVARGEEIREKARQRRAQKTQRLSVVQFTDAHRAAAREIVDSIETPEPIDEAS